MPSINKQMILLLVFWLNLHNETRAMPVPYMKNGSHQVPMKNGLFEGDLKIPMSMIMDHYNLSSIPGGESILLNHIRKPNTSNDTTEAKGQLTRNRRAAGSTIQLWINGRVYYRLSPNISEQVSHNITAAMKQFEKSTCLNFVLATNETDYIQFTTTDMGCYSDSIGRYGREQIVNVEDYYCTTIGTIVHEIGHAIGFWHEQSRPDRDGYVKVNFNNIDPPGRDQFYKRNDFDVDYQGTVYDYGSIMHYRQDEYHKPGCNGSNCITLSVKDQQEYQRQGMPILGQEIGLSAEDIVRINRLYSCSGTGIRGFLSVHIKQGISLLDTDDKPDPYVHLTAVASNGKKVTHQTSCQPDTQTPIWNEYILFGEDNWQFMRLSAWDKDVGIDDQLTMSQTIPLKSGHHVELRNCENVNCDGYVLYEYFLDTRSIPNARLQVYVRGAQNLKATDPVWNAPDPYVRITAIQSNGITQLNTSRIISGTTNPNWNQWIDYGCQKWRSFFIEIMDDDIIGADRMSDRELVSVSPGYYPRVKHPAYNNGLLTYDYKLIEDANDCSHNPCENGGTCTDGCESYTCHCHYGFVGETCQHFAGMLRVNARQARNLNAEDGWPYKSDPYMTFIATDVFGKSVRTTTTTIHDNLNPNWNEELSFGYGAWRSLTVRVYDEDWSSDDALSDEQTVSLSSRQSQSNVKHQGYGSGYATFDYIYN